MENEDVDREWEDADDIEDVDDPDPE